MMEKEPYVLDVRPLLAAGEEPFGAIMAAKSQIAPGQCFQLIAPFPPEPLYGLFEAEGYTVQVQEKAPGEWHVLFHPPTAADGQGAVNRELDLRFLEPPAPLQKGLEAVRQLGRGKTVVLHTRFHPVHLFEQLEGEAFDYDSEEVGPNHWTSHIWRLGEG
ncbi:MAG: DUF2249 domain-containing protein [Opitutales bacterium]